MRTKDIKKTLSNGVKLYLYLDKKMRKSYADYGVDYGSNGKWHKFYLDNEYHEVLPGCAHFLEHMLGEHSKYGNFYTTIAQKKYQINATTYFDITHFYFQGTEDFLECLEKLINIVDDPIFNESDVEMTKRAIAEETKRVLNNKIRMGMSICSRNLYKDLNLYDETLSTIGNEETTHNLNYQTLKDCYDAFYYDANKTLIIAGNFDEEEITNYLENIYKKLPKHPNRLREFTYKELDKKKKEEEIYYMSTNDDFYTIEFKQNYTCFSKKEIYYFVSFIVNSKFNDDKSFIKKLKKNNIITNIQSFDTAFIDDIHYYIELMANVKDSKKFKQALLKEIKTDNFKEKDFDLFIRNAIANQIYQIDNKYNNFLRFFPRKHIYDDFDTIDFLKSLTFFRFQEFYNSLNFDDYSISIIRDSNKK